MKNIELTDHQGLVRSKEGTNGTEGKNNGQATLIHFPNSFSLHRYHQILRIQECLSPDLLILSLHGHSPCLSLYTTPSAQVVQIFIDSRLPEEIGEGGGGMDK